ncbi:uncharacterized protein K460DRAFT_407609 [Cucurbitaria berberidis CBS 394.84]|uniref:Uncharacterized protein n=1 Tax=Cucurbitaria berberidis CBS 394.84 TaxID=1168544 RepID=A0A9P4GCA9_9PLEO|nr:uncharacterized protein K460DRAFT_407609 [Cucurbitaria berberidis CBS 394.84]KAF1843243.1 hypothetical protein K460DRAFT_407609 [Cucurbitaria berberidis CBS 394.84]
MPQTDPTTAFPNYEYCTEEHLKKDVEEHQDICARRWLPAWIAFVDSAINIVCLEEQEALHWHVVTRGPELQRDGAILFTHRPACRVGERKDMFPSDMKAFDRQSAVFFHNCRHTIHISTGMTALLFQDLPVSLRIANIAGTVPKQEMRMRRDYNSVWSLAQIHTVVEIAPQEEAHESICGGLYLDPSRPQYRYEQGAILCSKYPVDTTTTSSTWSDFGFEYDLIKAGRYNELPDQHILSRTQCLECEITARTINNVLWDVIREVGGLQSLRAMNEEERNKVLQKLRLDWRDRFRKLRDDLDHIHFPTQESAQESAQQCACGPDDLAMLEDRMDRAMGDGHVKAMEALKKVAGRHLPL